MIRKLIHTKFMTKLILVLFCVSIFLPGLPLLLTSLIESAAYAGESGYTVSDAVYKTVNYYLTHKNILTSWQEVWSLNKAGVDLSDDEKWSLPEWNIENNDALEYANKIIGIYCSGEDPSDLVTQLLSKQIDNGSFGESLNYTYWSIIALNMVNAGDDNSDAVSKAINYLISQQNDDGGFPITVKGDPSGADTTGMALLALSPYRVQDGVSECVERAINYLQNIQMDNGAFSYDGTVTAESTAFAIIGLVASGEDITDNKWKKDNRTIIDALMDFQLGDGSFSHLKGSSSNSIATSQALLALSYLLVDYSDYVIIDEENASDDPEIKPEIRVRIEGQYTTLFDGVIEVTDETTGLELLRTAIGEENIGLIETEYGKYIAGLLGETPEDFNDYWGIYTVTDNELKFALEGIETLPIAGIDELLLHFCSWGITKEPKITIEKSGLNTVITVKASDTEEAVQEATIKIGSETYVTDENGQISVQLPPGNYIARVEKQGDVYPELIRTEVAFTVEKVEVRVRIEGQYTTLFDGVIEVTDETTGLELLRTAIGEENIVLVETEYGKYIAGLLGETPEDFNDYWGIYTVTDNELKFALEGIETLPIAGIDELLLHFLQLGITKEPKITIEKSGLNTVITVKASDTEEAVQGAIIKIGSETYVTDENGQISVQLPPGNYIARVEKQGDVYPELIRTEIAFLVEQIGGPGGGNQNPTGISIRMAVVGKDGKLLFGPSTVKLSPNSNVLDALDASGLNYKVRSDGYIEEIAGQKEKELGSQSGWKYKVNNIVSNLNARDYMLNNGDRLIWWYAIKTDENGPSWSDIESARPGEPIKNVEKVPEKTGDELIEEQIAKEDNVIISLEERAEPFITFSKATFDKLVEANKPLVIKNAGAEIIFEPQNLLTEEIIEALQDENSKIKIEVKALETENAKAVLDEVAEHKNGKFEVLGKIFEFSFKILTKHSDDSVVEQNITEFKDILPVKVDLSSVNINEDAVNNLTAIRYELDEEGNFVPVKLGGNYDAQEKIFTFYTDGFSLYGVVKAQELTKISLGVNKPVYFINGAKDWTDVPPTILNGRTMVPIRLIAEGLGAKVEWLEDSRMVAIKSGPKTLSFAIGQLVEGMDTPAVILNLRTMVPLRYVSENLGARVLWFDDTKTIEIIK